MALIYSPPVEKDKNFSHFQLTTVKDTSLDTRQIPANDAVVLMFICNHCPYVKAIEDRLIQLAHDFENKNVRFLAICSNDPAEYPEDRPEQLLARAIEKKYPFEYLVDSDQSVAKVFGAVCTPDFFVFEPENDEHQRPLYYRGRLDDSWKDSARVTRQEMKEALQMLLQAQTSPEKQIPSMGCSIKWRES